MSWGRDLGIHPQNASAGRGRQRELLIPLFSSFFHFYFDLMVITFVQVLADGSPPGAGAKKSLAIQSGQTASPRVTPVLGKSGADVGAVLADPTAPVVAPTPAEVTEQAASSVADMEKPAEGRIPPVEVVVTAPSQD